ncbi:MAG: GNAT family N-acetyltransferase [Thermodesulfobacteriota bacterium]
MIRALTPQDLEDILTVINDGARAYGGVIPGDCWHEPYMPREELLLELDAGVRFWGLEKERKLAGVMGRQDLPEVTLIRHAYVRTEYQRQGIGSRLLARVLQGLKPPVLVGTWAAAWWAIRFYERHGFRLVTPAEKERLLRTYWTISHRQIETSVVLEWEPAKYSSQ